MYLVSIKQLYVCIHFTNGHHQIWAFVIVPFVRYRWCQNNGAVLVACIVWLNFPPVGVFTVLVVMFPFNGHCYSFVETKFSWNIAEVSWLNLVSNLNFAKHGHLKFMHTVYFV